MEGGGKRVHRLPPGRTVSTEGVTDVKYGFYFTLLYKHLQPYKISLNCKVFIQNNDRLRQAV